MGQQKDQRLHPYFVETKKSEPGGLALDYIIVTPEA